jgi:hypothetical protein
MIENFHHPALRLVEKQRTLVLAIADPAPWSAPVYYLCSHGEGLQMEGAVEHIHADKAAFDVLPAYLAKFPTVKHSFLPL